AGGVPLRTPVVLLRVSHDGRPEPLNVAAVVLSVVNVNEPVWPARNVALLALVKLAGVPTVRVAALEVAAGLTPLLTTTRNWSPDIVESGFDTVSVEVVTPLKVASLPILAKPTVLAS